MTQQQKDELMLRRNRLQTQINKIDNEAREKMKPLSQEMWKIDEAMHEKDNVKMEELWKQIPLQNNFS